MNEAIEPIDPIHSAMMLGMTPKPCEPTIEITRQAVTKLLDVVEFGDQLERVEKDRLVAFVKDLLAEDQPELWATYIPGPGEIHPCLTKEHAERDAKATLEVCEKMKADRIARGQSVEFWPEIVAEVIPSPFTPLEHFELLAKETIQHRDDLVEYAGELKNKLKETPEPAWRALIRHAMNMLNLRNHVPGSDVDLCVKALDDLLEGKHSPAPEPSEAWREVAEIAQAAAPAVVNQQVTTAAIAPDALEQARRHLSNAIEDAEDGKTAAALPALREAAHFLAQAAASTAKDSLSVAASDVLAERQRQITAEGYDSGHDDMATRGQLAIAAGCYAMWSGHPALMGRFSWKAFFPWDWKYWKPSTPRHNLIRAGALILAEIERLDRAEQAKQQEQQP